MKTEQTFASVWDALADTPDQAANLHARAQMMQEISRIITDRGWTQETAAYHAGVSQPRINDLVRGRISRFSLDSLVNLATALGYRVHLSIEHKKLVK